MESKTIYEESYKELTRIRKTLTNSMITINADKLDSRTKEELLKVISNTTSRRQSDILSVIGNPATGV